MGSLVDMARSGKEAETASPLAEPDKYPYGLRITLNSDEIEKLNVDHSDWEIGDVFPLDVIAKVVGININEGEGHSNCCISLQITHIGAEEEEDEDGHEEDGQPLKKHGYLKYDGY